MSERSEFEVIGKADRKLLLKLRQQESERINQEVFVERMWWKDHVISDESIAVSDGSLIKVPDFGKNYGLRWSLITSQEPNTIRPQAYRLLLEIQSRWQDAMEKYGENIADIYISVISLYRSLELQEKERLQNPLASQAMSAHTAGVAIDFDPNGYYWGDGRDTMQAHMVGYRNIYSVALRQVLERLVTEGACHLILEKSYKIEGELLVQYTGCYHVCVSPKFQLEYNLAE